MNATASPPDPALARLFSPIELGGLQIPNRIFMPSMGTYFTGPEGLPTPQLEAFYVERARGGAGLLVTEIHAVESRGRSNPQQLRLWSDEHARALAPMVAAIKAHGARVVAQLGHAGRQTTRAVAGGTPVGPSAGVTCERFPESPRPLEPAEIGEVVDAFRRAARLAVAAGYDGVEIHGAHGFLVAQFLSRYCNRRGDGYGGGIAGRARFAQEVVAAVRAELGPRRPLIVRLSADEGIDGGLVIAETGRIAALLEEAGADAIDISAGIVANRRLYCAPAAISHGHLLRYARAMRRTTRARLLVPGRITDPGFAEAALQRGDADMIGMARGLLVDPDLPRKARAGLPVRRCIGCHQGCRSHPISCMINPALGRELQGDVQPLARPSRVVVVGGGPAGLECARVAAGRGHEVVLYERGERLGGQLWIGALPPAKGEILDWLAWQEGELRRMGATLRIGVAGTAAAIAADRPDDVVLATGARPKAVSIPGADRAVPAELVLREGLCAASAIVIGAGETGAEVADFLRARGAAVTLVGSSGTVGHGMAADPHFYLMQRLRAGGVALRLRTRAEAIEADAPPAGGHCAGSRVTLADGVRRWTERADLVVLATGIEPETSLRDSLRDGPWRLHVIGDADHIDDAKAAILAGYRLGGAI